MSAHYCRGDYNIKHGIGLLSSLSSILCLLLLELRVWCVCAREPYKTKDLVHL